MSLKLLNCVLRHELRLALRIASCVTNCVSRYELRLGLRLRQCVSRKTNCVTELLILTTCIIIWKSLGDEHELSEQLKKFSNIAKKARENYIIEVFYKNKPAPLFKPIPITKQESIAQ